MAVDSVSSNIDLTTSYGARPKQEQNEAQQARNKAQQDNGHQNHVHEQPKPSVNTHGQTVGKIINSKA